MKSVCISHLEHISLGTDYISSAQNPHVAGGHQTRQHRPRSMVLNLTVNWSHIESLLKIHISGPAQRFGSLDRGRGLGICILTFIAGDSNAAGHFGTSELIKCSPGIYCT